MKARVKFRKQGEMKFIGHLDIMRFFQKAVRRSEIDICYSTGFSPHQVMSFASPLGVGLTSNGEYMDIEVKERFSSKEMMARLNSVMVEGMEIVSFKALADNAKNAMSIVAAADYTLTFRQGYEPDDMALFSKRLEEFASRETIVILKKTKKSEKETDIKPMLYDLKVSDGTIFMQLASGSSANLKPELVMEAFYKELGEELKPFTFHVQREELYADIGTDEERKLVSLDSLGEEIEK